jgi:hypothetical protein
MADFEALLDLVEPDLRYMKNKSGIDKIQHPSKQKHDEFSGLDDPDNGHDEKQIEVASTTDMKKKLRRVKLKRVLIPGVTKGIVSLTKALDTFRYIDDLQSKQEGGVVKVIYQVEDCYAFEDGEETRYTHRLLSSVLAHEVIHAERPKLDPQEEKRKQRRFAK